jgi:hypothetical protein
VDPPHWVGDLLHHGVLRRGSRGIMPRQVD